MKLEKVSKTQFLEKDKYNNNTVGFEIMGVEEIYDDNYLSIKEPNSEEEPKKLKLNGSIQNGCIDLFGDDTNDWIGNIIKLTFSDYEPEEGREGVSKGIQTVMELPEEESVKADE